ncbi:MAG: carbonic anhydrase [Bacteroidetes bacterium]|nr:carbonic anhydrase [Bacteroidota bacterium]
MTTQESIKRLKEGNARFVADLIDGKLQDSSRRESLIGGQEPYAIILGCADSRVVPELAFDAGLGELFTVRVAGNVANSSSIASIEYAVAHCGSKLIVVLGHQNCGAVTAAVAGGDNGYNLNHLLGHITPALAASEEGASINEVVKKNAELTVKELKSRSTIIRDAVDKGEVEILPAYYNLDTGKVDFLIHVEGMRIK